MWQGMTMDRHPKPLSAPAQLLRDGRVTSSSNFKILEASSTVLD